MQLTDGGTLGLRHPIKHGMFLWCVWVFLAVDCETQGFQYVNLAFNVREMAIAYSDPT